MTTIAQIGSEASPVLPYSHFTRLLAIRGDALARRADDDVLYACLLALSWNSNVPDGAVTVQVERGKVVLSGIVDLSHQRAAAEMSIQSVQGVVSVSNQVTVKAAPHASAVAADVHAAASRWALDGAPSIRVHVDGACVWLAGSAPTRAERDAAVAAAWAAAGTTHVIDDIAVPG